MPNRLGKNFTHFVGDFALLEYTFSDVSNLSTACSSIEFTLIDAQKNKLITKTLANGGIVVDATNQTICRVTLNSADTAIMTPGAYSFQVRIKDTQNRPITIAQGVMDLLESYF